MTMKPHLTKLFFAIVTTLLLSPQLSLAQPLPVFVESGELGQGILVSRLGACYGITPAHVIDGGFFASIVGGLPGAPKGDADVLMTFGYDLSLLRITGGVTNHCDESFSRTGNSDVVLSAASTGHLHTVRSDGSVSRQQVSLSDSGMLYVHVHPVEGGEPLMKGMSGSLLQVAGKPVGMLMSVDSASGMGKVLRYDRLTETIAPFFDGDTSSHPGTDSNATVTASATNLGKEVTQWSAPAVGPQYRAKNILDGDPQTHWLAKATAFPVDIEILLSAEKPVVLHGLEISTAGMANRQQTPRDYEIMVSTKASGRGWTPKSSGTLFSKDETTAVELTPVKARRVLLRLYSNWGDSEAIGVSDIRLR